MKLPLAALALLCVGCAASARLQAQETVEAEQPRDPKYPLRLHILAIDDTHRTLRLQPNWCAGTLPEVDGGAPCSSSGYASLGGGEDDFSGAGRADLVTPPNGTDGLDFTYEGCHRVRVAPGFTALDARWTRPGAKLQVRIPTDAIAHGANVTRRCTLRVKPQEFVYLLLPNGALLRVSKEAFASKPSLRLFLSGGSEALRRPNFVVPVKTLAQHPQQP